MHEGVDITLETIGSFETLRELFFGELSWVVELVPDVARFVEEPTVREPRDMRRVHARAKRKARPVVFLHRFLEELPLCRPPRLLFAWLLELPERVSNTFRAVGLRHLYLNRYRPTRDLDDEGFRLDSHSPLSQDHLSDSAEKIEILSTNAPIGRGSTVAWTLQALLHFPDTFVEEIDFVSILDISGLGGIEAGKDVYFRRILAQPAYRFFIQLDMGVALVEVDSLAAE